MQKISRRWWGAIALGAVLAFGVTACSTRKGSGMFDWIEGTKPLEERAAAQHSSPLPESVFAVTADTNCSPHRSPLISP